MSFHGLQDRAPSGEALTDYDRKHLVLYLRLLDAETDGADWREAAKLLLGVDVSREPDRARVMHATHLARAHWLRDGAYKELLKKP